jgi:hypothetical protein
MACWGEDDMHIGKSESARQCTNAARLLNASKEVTTESTSSVCSADGLRG